MIKTLRIEFTEKYKVVLVRRHSCYQMVWMISNNHIDKIPFTFMMAFQSFFFIHFNPLWQQCLQTFAVPWWNFHQYSNSLRQDVFSTIYFEFAIFQRRLCGMFHHWNCKCLASLFNKFGEIYLRIDCEVLFIAKWLIAFVY